MIKDYKLKCADCGKTHTTLLVCVYCDQEYLCVSDTTSECSNCLGGASFIQRQPTITKEHNNVIRKTGTGNRFSSQTHR